MNVFTQASADIVNYHISVVFKALDGENNYLRIQVIIKLGVTFSSYILVFFHFSSYILILPLLVPKSVNVFYFGPFH